MRPEESGIALLLAVWAVILIGGFVTGVMVLGGGDAAITANRIDMARAQGLAEAGVATAIAALTGPDFNKRPALAQPFSVELEDGARIMVEIRDSCGAIDINWAPEALLRAYAMTIGMKSDAAGRLAGAIVARRQAVPATGKDEWRTGPWQSLEQLADLPGMDKRTLEEIRPGLTVNCGEAGADPQHAPDTVREALGLSGVSGGPSHGLAYEIEAKARLASGAKVTLLAAIWLSRQPGPPYYFITGWRTL